MNILILGANGNVGSQVAYELISRGHTVVAGIHKNDSNIPPKAIVRTIDIRDKALILEALHGMDAVVCALSSWQASKHDVLSSAMKVIIPAMEQTGVKRIVSVSGDITVLPDETPGLMVKVIRKLLFGTVRKVVKDSEDHLHQLYASSLDWTVLRPTVMSDSDDSGYILSKTHPKSLFIPRVAVVRAIADLIEQNSHIHEAPYIVSR